MRRRRECSCLNCRKEFTNANIERHVKKCNRPPEMIICIACGIEFEKREGVTCTYACSNRYFKRPRKVTDEELVEKNRYRKLCFRYHDKKCIICDEDKIVSVHHFNGDSSDHRPENLVPLCPTHHMYMHSKFKVLILHKVKVYVEKFILSRKIM